MKKLIFIFSILFSLNATAQSYGDSSITLTLTQRTAYWIGGFVRQQFQWSERNAPTVLANYVGSGTRPDSVMANVTLKAKYILGAMELLISQPLQVVYTDYRSIVLNQPAVPGYTALATQVNTIANDNGAQKQTAIWLRDKFNERVAAYNALYDEQKNGVISWSKD